MVWAVCHRFIGAGMNMLYLLAGSASTNPVMLMLSLFLLMAWKVAGYYGLDRIVLPIITSRIHRLTKIKRGMAREKQEVKGVEGVERIPSFQRWQCDSGRVGEWQWSSMRCMDLSSLADMRLTLWLLPIICGRYPAGDATKQTCRISFVKMVCSAWKNWGWTSLSLYSREMPSIRMLNNSLKTT